MAYSQRCQMLAQQILKSIDREVQDSAEWSASNRQAGQVPISKSMWTVQGESVRDLGPGFAEMEPRDHMSIGSFMIYGDRQSPGGGDVGREIVRLSRAQFDGWRLAHSDDIVRLRPFLSGMNRAEAENWAHTIEQRTQDLLPNGLLNPTGSQFIKPLNARVERAVTEFVNWTREVAEQGNMRNLLVAFHENYLPHLRKTKTLDDPRYAEKAIEALTYHRAAFRTADELKISPYQVPKDKIVIRPEDRKFARDEYNYHATSQLARVAPQIEQLRTLDIPGYELDPMKIARQYSMVVRQRFAEHDVWGERDTLHGMPTYATELFGKLKELMPNVRDQARINAFISNQFGYSPFSTSGWSGYILGEAQALKMSMSTIGNSTQFVNQILRTNLSSFMKGTAKFLTDAEIAEGVGSREFALRAGLIADNVLKDAQLYQGGPIGQVVLTANGYVGIEKLLRMNSAINGAVFIDDMYKAADKGSSRAKTRLREMGFEYESLKRRNGPQFEDMLVAARRIVDETQHVQSPVDMPKWAPLQNPRWRWLMEFNTFNYKNTRMLVREFKRHPTRTAIFSLGVMPAVGEVSLFAQDLLAQGVIGAEPPEYRQNQTPFEAYVEAAAAGGSWSLATNLLKSIHQTSEGGWYGQRYGIVPPRASTAIDAVTAASHVWYNRHKELGKLLARQFGQIGSAFARRSD